MSRLALIASATAALASASAASPYPVGRTTGSVYYTAPSTYSFTPGVLDPAAAAWGASTDMLGTASGFGQLTITTGGAPLADAVQMYAAGYLEASLTAARISSHYVNVGAWIRSQFKSGVIPQNILDFFTTQDAWSRANVAANTSSPIWRATGLVTAQFDGLVAGYNAAAAASNGALPALGVFAFQQMNAIGDFLDLIPALGLAEDTWHWENMTDAQLMDRVRKTSHCSALVKVTGDLSELYFSHVAWFIYTGTTRIFKHYNFKVADAAVAGQQMSFASYPAYLSSLDDFYSIRSSGLNMLETTHRVFNMSLYKLVVPQSLFAWQRVRNANLLAHSGPEWGATLATYNSGTYNNQYMVVNVGVFAPSKALPDNILTIVEQIPGLVVYGDASQDLERGHFPSYNVPYFKEIYDMSGYTQTIASRRAAGEPLGELSGLDYQLAPRAKIFRRDNGKAETFDGFLGVMRYNDYKNDPYSSSPWDAICSRGDLAGSPDGCYDGKAGTAADWPLRRSWAINGPTTGELPPGGSLPPFSWAAFNSTSHVGLPEVYDFAFEAMVPDAEVWPISA